MASRHTRSTKPPTTSALDVTPDAPRCTLRPDIHEQLLKWWDEGFSAQAIVEGLRKQFGSAPHRNTVYKEVRRHAPPADAWTLADARYSPTEAGAVLEELYHVYRLSGGRRRHFSEREAWWVLRLKLVHQSPGFEPLEPSEAFRMARLHIDAEQRGEQLSPWLDAMEPAEARLQVFVASPHQFAPKEKQT